MLRLPSCLTAINKSSPHRQTPSFGPTQICTAIDISATVLLSSLISGETTVDQNGDINTSQFITNKEQHEHRNTRSN
ncbi:MAG: hypothetical protein Q8J76_04085 [Desulfobulbaceae bacterium]|nr:hypothetical protein [Desulfobulbaceae bacterium]